MIDISVLYLKKIAEKNLQKTDEDIVGRVCVWPRNQFLILGSYKPKWKEQKKILI